MKLIDYAPYVLMALRNGPLNQGDLTEGVFGSSGRGNSSLVNSLFPFCVNKGWMTINKKGRSFIHTLTSLGKEKIGDVEDPTSIWDCTTHNFK